MASTFDQRYPEFFVGHYNRYVTVVILLPVLSTLDKWSWELTFGTHHELEIELNNSRNQLLAEICLDLQGKIQSLAHTLLGSSYNFMMKLLVHTDAEISIMSCQGLSDKSTLSLLSDQLMHIFDDFYRARIMGRGKLGSSTVDETATILRAVLQSHEVMVEFSKHNIKCHPSITSIFFRFLITANILEPLQEIYQMKRDIKALITKLDCHHGRLDNIEE